MKLVGLSGAQGAGKSTLLNELEARGIHVDKFRVSRAVQEQLGWDSLDRVMDSPHTMIAFQEAVFEQKYKNDYALVADITRIELDEELPELTMLTERTFADIWAYTSQWTWRFVDREQLTMGDALRFLTPFTERCAGQNKIYSGVILLPYMQHMVWAPDANRAAQSDVDSVYEDVQSFVERKMPITAKRLVISRETVSDRADEVQTFLRSL